MLMIALYQDGRAEIVSPSRIFQGTDTEKIIVLSPFPATVPLQIAYTAPGGRSSGYAPMQSIELPDDYDVVSAWSYEPRGAWTAKNGEAYVNILVQLPSTTAGQYGHLTTYMARFTVEESTLPTLPSVPSPDVYEQVLRYLAEYMVTLNDIGSRMDEVEREFTEVRGEVAGAVEKVEKNAADMAEMEDWVKKERLIDFTVDPETGVGVKYFDNGKTATVQYPAKGAGDVGAGTGLVTELTFTAESFVNGECAFTKEQTGFTSDKYLATVEVLKNGAYQQTASSVFKGKDGSLLLSLNEAFAGRVLICGAGSITKGDTGTLIFIAAMSRQAGGNLTVGESDLVNLDIMPRKPQIGDLIVTRVRDIAQMYPSSLYRITGITGKVYDCVWLTVWSGYKGERGASWYFADKEISPYGNLEGSPGVTRLRQQDIYQYLTGIISLGEPKEHDLVLSRGSSNYGVVVLSDGENVDVRYLGSIKGERGAPFTIAATYRSVAAMEADFANEAIATGSFVAIDTGNVEDADNAKLYWKGAEEFKFLLDLSGSTGLTGPSAYEVAVNNGFVGSEAEWLSSLKGSDGADGEPGVTPTVRIGSVTTGNAYSDASVVNSGTDTEVVLDITLPRGVQGPQGLQGEPGDITDLPVEQNGKVLINDNGKVGYLDASAILGESFGEEATPIEPGQTLSKVYVNLTPGGLNAIRAAANASDAENMISLNIGDSTIIVAPLSMLAEMGAVSPAGEELSGFAVLNGESLELYYASQAFVLENLGLTASAGASELLDADGAMKSGDGSYLSGAAEISYGSIATEGADKIFSAAPISDKSLKEYIDEADGALNSRIDTVALGKVDKVAGKGLSANDFTDGKKAVLDLFTLGNSSGKNYLSANIESFETAAGKALTQMPIGLIQSRVTRESMSYAWVEVPLAESSYMTKIPESFVVETAIFGKNVGGWGFFEGWQNIRLDLLSATGYHVGSGRIFDESSETFRDIELRWKNEKIYMKSNAGNSEFTVYFNRVYSAYYH